MDARDHATARPRVPLALVLAVLLSVPWFFPALRGEFLTWDDDRNFLTNPDYRGLGWAQIRWMFSTFHLGHYQPLTWLTLGLDHALWGMAPLGYHVTNLALHGANVTLLFFLLRVILRRARPGAEAVLIDWAAAAGAVLFGAHPLRVESVVWVTERRQLLSTALLLTAVLCHLSRRSFAAVTVHALAALAAAWAVVLPPVLLVLDRYLARSAPAHRGRYALSMAPYVAVAATGVAVNVLASHAVGAGRPLSEHTLAPRIAQACFGLGYYLWNTLLPIHLAPLYELPPRLDPLASRYVASAVGVVIVTVALYLGRRRRPGPWTAWLCYGIVLLPALGLFQVGPHLVADRYSYLASMPIAALAAALLLGFTRRAPWISAAVLALMLGPLATRYSLFFCDSVSLWSRAVAMDAHSYVARTNLGHALEIAGRTDEAIDQYRRSLQIRPGERKTRYKLGLAYARTHRYDLALAQWRPLVAEQPRMAELHFSIGLASFRLGRHADAADAYRRAIGIEPGYVEAHRALSEALRALGRAEEAGSALDAARSVTRPYRPPY